MNFTEIWDRPDWERERLWTDWDNFVTSMHQEDKPAVVAAGPSGKAVKAQRKSAFGTMLVLDDATGLPSLPSASTLDESRHKTAQWWQHTVREFLTFHYGPLVVSRRSDAADYSSSRGLQRQKNGTALR